MHRHNSKYGYKKVLADYCGADLAQPILGEVQHSLFVSTHHFDSHGKIGPKRSATNFLIRFFSWNSFLPFRRQIVIGDPLTYGRSPKNVPSNPSQALSNSSEALLMPKFDQEKSATERLSHYIGLIALTRDSTDLPLRLRLHPGDAKLERELIKLEIISPEEATEAEWRQQLGKVNVIDSLRSAFLFSDYFGAHVFRANYWWGSSVSLIGQGALHSAIHPSIKPVFESYLDANDSQRLEISAEILGITRKRSPEELHDILYGEIVGSRAATRVWVGAYKAIRRVGVRARNHSWIGKSLIAKVIRRKVLNPLRAQQARLKIREVRG